MKEIKLPSGATLGIGETPFATSKALYQAILAEAKGLSVSFKTDKIALYQQIFCMGFSSERIESCLWECFKHCTYTDSRGKFKIDDTTFEPVKARDDFMKVCVEVAKENTGPFVKSLYAEFKAAMEEMDKISPA